LTRCRRRHCLGSSLRSISFALLSLVAPAAAAQVEVSIKGIEGALRDNVRAYLSLVSRGEGAPEDEALPEDTLRRLHRRAPDEIREALKPFGYYEPTVEGRLERNGATWRATYRVDPGRPVILERVRIAIEGDASDDPAFQEERSNLALAAGRQLNHNDYEAAKQALLQLAVERGYLDARWSARELRIDIAARKAQATLVLDSGPRYDFGEVRFADTVVDEPFLRRFLPFKEGEPYLAQQLLELQYRLDDSGYFRRVDVQAARGEADNGRVPVEVALDARPKHRYTFGVGYGTDTGARVRFGRDSRYINSRGHRFNVGARVAEISTEVEATYTIALTEPWRERLEIGTSLTDEEIGDGESRQFELALRRITDSGGWRRTLSLAYQRSRDVIGEEVLTRDLVLPGIQLSRSRYNERVYATRGYAVTGDVRGGSTTLGSDLSFLRGRLDTRGVVGLWPGGRLLAGLEVGRIRIWDARFDDLPLSQRFFAGGDRSVRGFAFQSLGPQDEQGRVIGGQYLGVASIELEQLIWGDWGAAVFVDHGNALADLDDPLRTGAGVGLRYRSPVGVFRVDVAKAIDGDESPRLHLSLSVDL